MERLSEKWFEGYEAALKDNKEQLDKTFEILKKLKEDDPRDELRLKRFEKYSDFYKTHCVSHRKDTLCIYKDDNLVGVEARDKDSHDGDDYVYISLDKQQVGELIKILQKLHSEMK